MRYQVGSLVKARGREWVVLPDTTDDWLILRPLGGMDREITGIFLPLEGEDVQPATFELPDPTLPGDFLSIPRFNVEPRPYKLVPHLMALKLDPISSLRKKSKCTV